MKRTIRIQDLVGRIRRDIAECGVPALTDVRALCDYADGLCADLDAIAECIPYLASVCEIEVKR